MLTIGITGTLGAGKGTVVEYLVSQKKFKHFSASEYLTQELARLDRPINRDSMREIANEIRAKMGPDYITKILFEQAKVCGSSAIIESIRNLKEAEFIKLNGGYLFAVDADQKTRYQRALIRGSQKDSVTFKEFQLQEEKESKNTDPNAQNLNKCILLSDYKFDNNGTVAELYKKIEDVIQKISG